MQLAINGYTIRRMGHTSHHIYPYVVACLAVKAIPQKRVARESGVPFSTVAKIAQGVVLDPSVHTVQRLYDYFIGQRAAVPALPAPGDAPQVPA